MINLAQIILKKATEMISSDEFRNKHKSKPKDFTRQRKLGFTGVMAVTLGIIVKSLTLELNEFFEKFASNIATYSKQAFSKSRATINTSAFIELYEMSVNEILVNDSIKRYLGYRFFAIDGTDLMLPQSKEIRAKYKPVSGSRLPHARASFFYDVISNYLIHACFDVVETDERTMAFAHLEAVKSKLDEKDVIIADRGYPSKDLIAYLFKNKLNFIMRLQRNFSAFIDASTETDFIWEMVYSGNTYPVRVIKVYHEDHHPTIIITCLSSDIFSADEIAVLYTKRWPVETRFEALKVKLEAEKFSGKTEKSLKQDFYARLFLMNIEAAIKSSTDEIIETADKTRQPKHPRKTNENILFGLLRGKMQKLLLEHDDNKRDRILADIITKASKSTVQIKPGRSFKRGGRSHKRITESKKRCL